MKISRVFLLIFPALALCVWPGCAQDKEASLQGKPPPVITKTVDPCAIATVGQIKPLIAGWIRKKFPWKHDNQGRRVTIANPTLAGATCYPFKTTISARIRYLDNPGKWEKPRIIGGGDAQFTLSLATKIEYKTNLTKFDAPVRTTDLIKAEVCLTDIQGAGLNLKNDPNWPEFKRLECQPVNRGLLEIVPTWLNDGWFKDQLNNLLSNQACFDITTLTRTYLRNGASL